VKIVDANVLIYAVNGDAEHHEEARSWLDGALSSSGGEPVGLAWVVLLAFWRVTTHPAIFSSPLEADVAASILESWMTQPSAVVVAPTARHLGLMTGLLSTSGAAANLVNDAHLAALALEHGATLVSYDRDLTRFSGVRVVTPSP
jgi:uncharacterized protein